MRKSERQITEVKQIEEILDKCQTMRLGINGKDFPYVVPLSYGWEKNGDKYSFFFHCAKEGKKLDMVKANNRVCVEFDLLNGYKCTPHGVTADYKSVIAFGTAEEVFGEEAVRGIELLLTHCGITGYSARECVKMNVVAVYKVQTKNFTGKKRF